MTEKTVVCIGDSLTYGYLMDPGEDYPSRVARLTGLRVINAGVNGDTAEDIERRFQRRVLAAAPDACVLLGGSNDVFPGTHGRANESLKRMVERGIEADIRMILCTPFHVLEDIYTVGIVDEINGRIHALAENLRRFHRERSDDFELLDLYEIFRANDDHTSFYLDGIHLNAKGNAFLAAVVARALTEDGFIEEAERRGE